MESFSKAAEAFKQGRKDVASYYAQQVGAIRLTRKLCFEQIILLAVFWFVLNLHLVFN